MSQNEGKIIHAARLATHPGKTDYLLLRQVGDQQFRWDEFKGRDEDKPTEISSQTITDAIRIARVHWKYRSIQMVNCGFRYTLPERDEHGSNALFHQMIASYASSNGIYFDAELGNNCFVNFASEEARRLWKRLKETNKL